jgi:hypothetical protein
VLGGDGAKDLTMEVAACYDETYGSLAGDLEGEIDGSLLKVAQYWLAEPSPGYYSGSGAVGEDDDKDAVVESWPVVLPEGTPP